MSVKQRMTAEELWEMPDIPGKRFELVRGELVEMSAAGVRHGWIAMALARLVDAFVRERRLGETFGDGVGYVIAHDPDIVRVPDASFIARDRIPEEGLPEGFFPGAPDLAVEIVSPGDRAEEVVGKVREYLAGGTRLVWVLWPRDRFVSVHTPDGVWRELGPDDELEGGDVLPGFQVRVAEVFERGR